jgi:antitoxin (DNA-binding transcriptional repressor) of toxin-antitoxin stability system
MPSMNIRQLRDSKQLKEWLRAGKTVELRERNEVIGEIVPKRRQPKPVQYPDFEARAKTILGDRILPNLILEDRGRY